MFGASLGVGMIVLQILRAFTVIGLCAATASCWILMLHIDQERGWFPFEGASIFFLSVLSTGLILTEYPVFSIVKNFFRETLPMLGPDSGLGCLASCLVVIGCSLLAKLNQAAFDSKNMGDAFRQLILASGILNLIFGLLNAVGTFIWSNRKEGITARSVRSMGSLAQANQQGLPSWERSSINSVHTEKQKRKSKFHSMFWKGGKPVISDPMPANDYDEDVEARHSPIVPGVKRPDTALHPMHTGASSRYSEAHMSRF